MLTPVSPYGAPASAASGSTAPKSEVSVKADAGSPRSDKARVYQSPSIASVVGRKDCDDYVPWSGSASQVQQCFAAFNDDAADRCGSFLVVKKTNPLRTAWTGVITILLMYTGTIFIYRMCFVTFGIEASDFDDLASVNATSGASDLGFEEPEDVWDMLDLGMTYIFWVDLAVNFFFTYDDPYTGREVTGLRNISRNYLRTYFVIDLIACIPQKAIEGLLNNVGSGSDAATLNQGAKVFRLQRISRLSRLIRLARLGKFSNLQKTELWKVLTKKKGLHVINLTIGLLWVVHILACGWFLCAALHDDPSHTWLARRPVDASGEVFLIDSSPVDQWWHSMYFVLTVFTTVGFGDMSAITNGEIAYVCFTMGVGAVVHSIIMSEVINVVTTRDKTDAFVSSQVTLLEQFAEHTSLAEEAMFDMKNWMTHAAKFWASDRYNRDEMKELITGSTMPRNLLGRLPAALFSGKLVNNSLMKVCKQIGNTPPRLPVLLALAAHRSSFGAGEIVYQTNDFPFNLFIVLSGVFAYVAQPSSRGGVPFVERPPPTSQQAARDAAEKAGAGGGAASTATGSGSGGAGAAGIRHSHSMAARAAHLTNEASKLPGFADRKSQSSTDTANEELLNQVDLCPYQTFSGGSYFGDIELLKGCQRRTTARCEVDAIALVIHKADMLELCHEFPQYWSRWLMLADARERTRILRQMSLTEHTDHEKMAAGTILRFFKAVSQMTRSKMTAPEGNGGRSDGRKLVRAVTHHGVLTTKKIPNKGGDKDQKDMQSQMDMQSQQMDKMQASMSVLEDKMDAVLEALRGASRQEMLQHV